LFVIACGAAATATPVPKAAAPEAPKAPVAAAPAATIAPAAPTATPSPTPAPVVVPKAKLDRLKIAVAPVGFDTNLSWTVARSDLLDKRPFMEYLIGIDRETGGFKPELAEKWQMAPNGKEWTITLRKGVKFHGDKWGEVTAKDVRHSVLLVNRPDSAVSDLSTWRTLTGVGKNDSIDDVTRKITNAVEVVNDQQVLFRLTSTAPEFFQTISGLTDLVILSKAQWDAGGEESYRQKPVGTGPFELTERKEGVGVFYKRVPNHWRKTPEFNELEFRWVKEDATRLATLLTAETQISDVPRVLQKDALARQMKIASSPQPVMAHIWLFGGLYFATPEKLDPQVPFVKKEVRQAMNIAINRKAINDNLLGGRAQPHRVHGFHPDLDDRIWPGLWNSSWEKRFDELYGYNPAKAKALLAQAGYPNGFEFTVYLYALAGLPEIGDIGQAIALDFEKVGLKPKLVELEFPRARGLYRTKAVHNSIWGLNSFARTLDIIRIYNKATDSTVYSFEDAYIEERLGALGTTVDGAERTRLLREIGNHKFDEFAEMPLFWLYAEVMVNPQYIAEYVFPGTIAGSWTHLEYVKLAQ